MDKVGKEPAIADMDRWLDNKKISEKKRASYKDQIESLVDAICEGTLVVNDKCELVQTLKFEVGDLKELKYKPRLRIDEVQKALQGSSSTNADSRIVGYVSALTGTLKGLIAQLDTEDYSIAQNIAIFFL